MISQDCYQIARNLTKHISWKMLTNLVELFVVWFHKSFGKQPQILAHILGRVMIEFVCLFTTKRSRTMYCSCIIWNFSKKHLWKCENFDPSASFSTWILKRIHYTSILLSEEAIARNWSECIIMRCNMNVKK